MRRRNPLVSLVYERGWRQGFAWAGFPGAAWHSRQWGSMSAAQLGIVSCSRLALRNCDTDCAGVEREFDMAMDLLRPAYGKVLVDMSCGSGIFSRRFASSRQFSGLIAADYSESMLQQTQRTFDDDGFSNGG